MKLLVCTQSVDLDNPVLGFFHRWLVELSHHFDMVTVLCLEEGRHDLPENVKVISLGKEKGGSKASFAGAFLKHIYAKRRDYDVVFVHMNPIYIALGGMAWKMMGKKVALWYTHRQVDTKLRIAEKFANIIFTASKEGFTLKSSKVMVTGHGIDIDRFASAKRTKAIGAEPLRIVHVGRVTPIKNCDILVEAANILNKEWKKKFEVVFAGSPATSADKIYADEVGSLVERYGLADKVHFIGNVSPADIPMQYAASDLSINLTPKGGLDKAVLESMASGVPVIASNVAFADYFGTLSDSLIFKERDPADLAAKIQALFEGDAGAIGARLQAIARDRAGVSALIAKLSEKMKSITSGDSFK